MKANSHFQEHVPLQHYKCFMKGTATADPRRECTCTSIQSLGKGQESKLSEQTVAEPGQFTESEPNRFPPPYAETPRRTEDIKTTSCMNALKRITGTRPNNGSRPLVHPELMPRERQHKQIESQKVRKTRNGREAPSKKRNPDVPQGQNKKRNLACDMRHSTQIVTVRAMENFESAQCSQNEFFGAF